ncbi:hypothetical protein L249_6662, partial [Ophiocordyceps polyrhachis-furcata BCC 54312]
DGARALQLADAALCQSDLVQSGHGGDEGEADKRLDDGSDDVEMRIRTSPQEYCIVEVKFEYCLIRTLRHLHASLDEIHIELSEIDTFVGYHRPRRRFLRYESKRGRSERRAMLVGIIVTTQVAFLAPSEEPSRPHESLLEPSIMYTRRRSTLLLVSFAFCLLLWLRTTDAVPIGTVGASSPKPPPVSAGTCRRLSMMLIGTLSATTAGRGGSSAANAGSGQRTLVVPCIGSGWRAPGIPFHEPGRGTPIVPFAACGSRATFI